MPRPVPLSFVCDTTLLPEPDPDPLPLLVRTVGMIDPDELEKLEPEDLLPLPLLDPLLGPETDPPIVKDGDPELVRTGPDDDASLCVHMPSARYVFVPGTRIATVRTRPSMRSIESILSSLRPSAVERSGCRLPGAVLPSRSRMHRHAARGTNARTCPCNLPRARFGCTDVAASATAGCGECADHARAFRFGSPACGYVELFTPGERRRPDADTGKRPRSSQLPK